MQLRNQLLSLFKKHPGKLFKTNELSKLLAIKSSSPEHQLLRETLDIMTRDGEILRETRRRYGLPPVIRMDSKGERHVSSDENGMEDAPREPQHMNGILTRTRKGFVVTPESQAVAKSIFVARKDLHGAQEGDHVTIELFEPLSERHPPEGFVVQRTASPATTAAPKARTFTNDPIISEMDLPEQFPKAVLKEAKQLPNVIPESEIKKRLDLRGEIVFTIDPEDAKDFDDAVSLTSNEDGTLTLGVHIADVSHYVREGAPLDTEALERGTSVYLVGSVIPMLPERISNELCSLRPDEDKLAYSVLLRVDPKTGHVTSAELKKTVIRSVMRFSYEEAEQRISTGRGKYAKLLREMRRLSMHMYDLRRESGAIDFESEEFRFRFENGEPAEAVRKKRLGSMRMIEDFMLAANRAVAEFIARKSAHGAERPFLYRIHALPDAAKVREVAQLAKSLGYKLNAENPTPKTIQTFLESLKGKPEEHLLNQLMLRAMAKAVYSEYNVGHFGLAFLHYTHFTSPIRRYPDLIVHRMLFEYQFPGSMTREREQYYYALLPEIANQTSAMERRATDAERASVKLAQIHILRNKLGEEFDGIISGVTHFGLFVELASGAEGLIHIRSLPGYYEFDESRFTLTERPDRFGSRRMERKFQLGQRLRVQLVKVNEEKRQVDFRLAEEPSSGNARPAPIRPTIKKRNASAARPRKSQRQRPRSR